MLIDSLKQSGALVSSSTNAAAKTAASTTERSQTAPPQNHKLQQQLNTLSQWSVNADVSRQLAKNQQAEQQLRQLYQQLEQLKKQLHQAQSAEQRLQITAQMEQMEAQLKHKDSTININLELVHQPELKVSRQLNNKIDLLSPRKQAEHLQISLADGSKVQLNFPANQSQAENLDMLKTAFAPLQIDVRQQNNQLVFSTAANQSGKLNQPWQLQGEGIRIAAGNPVTVKLQEPAGTLSTLSQISQQVENQQIYQSEIKIAQQKLQQVLRQVQAERQMLIAKLNSLRLAGARQTEDDAYVVSQELKQQMQMGAASSMSAIMAQGNVTRGLVEFALAQ
ncbi:hypothetical protein [Rheinheimera sp.]|uniref:hypothetical protein n=1 Tax=Rheinheimera sp. TaxID=1869214 RepID=UPI0027BACFA6|nr:hypothetical protein [Rheinheimera sp.]